MRDLTASVVFGVCILAPVLFVVWDRLPRIPRYEIVVYKYGVPTPIGVPYRRRKRALARAEAETAIARTLGRSGPYGVERVR